MSVQTVTYLEPQRGGCSTVMSYFIGDLLELPLTTVQDHSLFYILAEQAIDLWKQQIEIIRSHYGLISFIVHPDYIVRTKERRLYCELLQHIADLRSEGGIWVALPDEIDTWWRQRTRMQLVQEQGRWQVRGEGSERARVAYAKLTDGKLAYWIGEKPITHEREHLAFEKSASATE